MHQSKLIYVVTFISLVSMMGCQKKDKNPVTLQQVYDENRLEGHQATINNMRDKFQLMDGFGTQKPYAPIVTMPQTVKVWVPDRYIKEDDTVSQGHWVHLKLYDGDFAIKRSSPTSPYGLENLNRVETPEVPFDPNAVHEVMTERKKKSSGMDDYPSYGVPISYKEDRDKQKAEAEAKKSSKASSKQGDNEEFNSAYKR